MKNSEILSSKKDKELVILLINNSQDAYKELYVRYKARLIHFCIRLLKNESDAEDMVHDIFLKIWIIRHSLKVDLSFWGYLQTTAKNLILNKFRQIDIHERFAQYAIRDKKNSTNQTDDSIINDDYKKLLNTLIENLPPKQREVYLLNRIQGLTYNEIAKKLQISVYTVREYISLALRKIKRNLPRHTDIHFDN